MKKHLSTTRYSILSFIAISVLFSACDPEDPEKENAPELITKVTLTFKPVGGGPDLVFTATDPDGEGVQDLATDGPILLSGGKTYQLAISLINELAEAQSPEYDISKEVEEEGDEHILLFGWSNEIFQNPDGGGNISNFLNPVNYLDTDSKGLPIGLSTEWTTIGSGLPKSATFRIILKHQPGTKSATSGAQVGETDLDVTFNCTVQ